MTRATCKDVFYLVSWTKAPCEILTYNCSVEIILLTYVVVYSDDSQLVSATSRRQLWSSSVQTCVLQCTTAHMEDRAFAAAGLQRL